MASRKKSSRSKKKKSLLSLLFWFVVTAVSGGGMGGVMFPEWPIVGALVQKLGIVLETPGQPGMPQPNLPLGGGAAIPTGSAVPSRLAAAQRPADRILIASYNIQVFGTSKLAKPDAMGVIVDVIRQFDLVAIQEVRAKEDHILPSLIAALNADGHQYNYLIGPRLGRTVSTEQYAYVYDTTRIEHDPSSVGTIQDQADLLHREPFVARFRARTSDPQRGFTFWLVNTHTDPDEVPQEVAALAQVFQVMQTARPDEDDVILLGDLNADESQLGPLAMIPGIHWVVRGVTTNTRYTKAYDNILFQAAATAEYTGRWGVVDVPRLFQLNQEGALRVSDHLPVWAEFSAWEAYPQRRAQNPQGSVR